MAWAGWAFLGLMDGDLAWIVGPLAQVGLGLNGLGWIGLGLDVATRSALDRTLRSSA